MMAAPDRSTPVLSIRGLVKDYGANRVLDGVDLDLHAGEIHALLGENGAGKSTLIKAVAGVESRGGGSIAVCGRALSAHPTPHELEQAGIGFVHQDLGLIDTLSVAENIALPDHFVARRGLISFRRTRARARDLLREVGVDLDPDRLVGDLQQDERVMVAVARAFALKAQAIVLDEVSASLPTPELERFAASIRRSTQAGVGYLYVTHRLTEVFDLATRVTVLRDGRVVGSAPVADVSHDQVVEWIVGRAVSPGSRRAAGAGDDAERSAEDGLLVRELLGAGLSAPATFDVARGEMVALCGLVGSGVRAVAQLLGGAATVDAGCARLDGRELPLGSPPALADAGVAYVPGNRDSEGAVLDLTIRENLFVAKEPGGGDGPGFLRMPRRERPLALGTATRFRIRPADDVERLVATLSGGNRQKVVFARAMRRAPALLVLDDPTQGVDVGSRAELHALMRSAADAGMAIVFASSDFEEVASEADRALVFCQGRLSEELSDDQLTADALARASYADSAARTPSEVLS